MFNPLIKLDNYLVSFVNLKIFLDVKNNAIDFQFLNTTSSYDPGTTYKFNSTEEAILAFEKISKKLEEVAINNSKFLDLSKNLLILDNKISNTLNKVRPN